MNLNSKKYPNITYEKGKITKIEIDEFKSMNENQKLDYIKSLQEVYESGQIIEFLTQTEKKLSTELLSMFAVAYNNNDQIEEAMKILEMIPESERDAKWYYRYGYSYAYRIFPNDSMEDNLKALEFFEKAIERSDDYKVISWCLDIIKFCNLYSVLQTTKLTTPLLHKYYIKSIGMTEIENQEKADDKYKKLRDIHWIFDKNNYSREEFDTKLNKILEKNYGKKWWDTNVNDSLEEPEILLTYEAWIESENQLYNNERLNEQDELLEEDKEDGLWQVEIMTYLKADNGNFFTVTELLFKLQNLMATKELGDHVFFEGIEYEGIEYDGNGLFDNEDGIPVFHIICGS